MQATVQFAVADYATFKIQLLNWASQFNSCCFLDNHFYASPWQQQECLVAAGSIASVSANAGDALSSLNAFIGEHQGQWIFGHLGFGLQAETEAVPNRFSTTASAFPDLQFFVPSFLVQCNGETVAISGFDEDAVLRVYDDITGQPATVFPIPVVQYHPLISREDYLQIIHLLREHIRRGDCYEINFCQEFLAENVTVDPASLYLKLSRLSPNPFSCYYRQQHMHLACASPERYVKGNGRKVISQPIKGTSARDKESAEGDLQQKNELKASAKDRTENVMVVDLVRNDLSKVCKRGTVRVEELFGIYTYPQVHQMISTIGGELRQEVSFADLIAATFPMGSMTGAPKKRVLELINQYEPSARGIFSGSVGYIQPNGDFDFNVVIRSMVYNQQANQISFHVGSGITWYSQAENEYEECLWKAAAIEQVLQG
jgi:para-aminobenzoate synthetase component 1